MNRRLFTFAITIVFLISACSPTFVKKNLSTATAIPTLMATEVPATSIPSLEPATQAATSQPALPIDWLSQLEIIRAGNWSRLQLLKTFPAEIPLNHSAVAISPDGKTLAVGSSEGAQIFFFDLPGGQLSRTVSLGGSIVGEYFNIVGMEYLPDGTLMANSTGPYMVYHINADGNVLSAWYGSSFALSSDGSIMAYPGEAVISLVEMANSTPLFSLDDRDALSFAFSPDGSKLAAEGVGVDFIHTAVWDVTNKTILRTLDETALPRYSPDGKFLAVIYYDNENNRTPLKILSPDGATEITTLNVSAPNDLTNRTALWTVDGSVVAAQIANGPPAAWDTTTWQPLEMTILEGVLYSFSPDGRILITRALDGSILLWGVLP